MPEDEVPIAWWPREERYAERLAPGTKFADIIGEIDPAKLAGGTSMSAEEALHFGLIPRMHRGIFAMNELPELDELVQVGLFNILEERDVQIRGYPIQFDIDVLILFSANPATYNRSGKVIPQLKDRIGSVIHTHYPLRARPGHPDHGAGGRRSTSAATSPSSCPTSCARSSSRSASRPAQSKYIDQQSGVSARFSIANYRTMVASARQRGVRARRAAGRAADQRPGPPLLLVARQAGARHDGQPPDDRAASARRRSWPRRSAPCSRSTSTSTAWPRSPRSSAQGVKIEVGDMLPSSALRRAAEARAAGLGQGLRGERLRATRRCGPRCVEFVLAGLYATDRISRAQHHGRIVYEIK